MAIEINCHVCGKLLRAKDSAAGKTAACPDFGTVLQIPMPFLDEGEEGLGDHLSELAKAKPQTFRAAPEVLDAEELDDDDSDGEQDTGDGTRRCPMCGETIKKSAVKCRWCGEVFDKDLKGGRSRSRNRKIEWTPSTIDLGTVMGTAWRRFQENVGLLVGVTLVAGLVNGAAGAPNNILQGMMQGADPDVMPILVGGSLLATIFSLVAQTWIGCGLTVVLLKVARQEQADLSDLFSGGRYLLRGMGCVLLYGLMVFLGFLALIIPGIYLALAFQPFFYVLVDTDAPGIESLGRSREITRGNLVTLFAIALMIMIVNVLGLLALCIGLLFTIPLTQLYSAVAYVQMTGTDPDMDAD